MCSLCGIKGSWASENCTCEQCTSPQGWKGTQVTSGPKGGTRVDLYTCQECCHTLRVERPLAAGVIL